MSQRKINWRPDASYSGIGRNERYSSSKGFLQRFAQLGEDHGYPIFNSRECLVPNGKFTGSAVVFSYLVVAASNEPLRQLNLAVDSCKACDEVLPNVVTSDIDRVPLKDATKMEERRARSRQAGLAL